MPKAVSKNTRTAKRARPGPIIQLIKDADRALEQYRIAESNVKVWNTRLSETVLDKITRQVAKEIPESVAGAVALIRYPSDRTTPDMRSVPWLGNAANLHQLLFHAHAMLKESASVHVSIEPAISSNGSSTRSNIVVGS
jgi:hypothetical protein